ncbi:cyclin-like f-box [Fusarium beomiforme]|uniref:Cyclin-like f-box n=1 Tax=Fusarium beomiforme TaxID=44412 RepID=A0A9P5DRY9_9HYPO|nr:cyclin-like f-box [Fusarium beomiforme]
MVYPTLTDLPSELIDSIARLLDPVGLMSLSLISRRFRQIIILDDKHKVEYLLALECVAEHGRGRLPDTSGLTDALVEHRLKDMRFACTGCIRLLSHTQFEDQFLFAQVYRKPLPGEPVEPEFTSWGSTAQERAEQEEYDPDNWLLQHYLSTLAFLSDPEVDVSEQIERMQGMNIAAR